MKKILFYTLILSILVGLFGPVYKLQAQIDPDGTCTIEGKVQPGNWKESACRASSGSWVGPYVLLAPLPCDKPGSNGCTDEGLVTFDPRGEGGGALGGYLNLMIKLFIGICAVLAVIMIVIGGIQYMTTELISSKEEGKKRIMAAIFGLLLALGAYTILYSINPDLLNSDLSKLKDVTVSVTLDEALFEKTEQATSAGSGYKLNGAPSSGVSDFVNSHFKKGEPLSAIVVDTATHRAYFYVGEGWDTSVSVPVNLGYNGVAEIGEAKGGDAKTPKGTTTLGSPRIASGNNAVTVAGGKYNVGAAFIDIGVAGRGIGFHGSASNALGTTNGCVRMTNDDLAALAPYMKAGTKVIIK